MSHRPRRRQPPRAGGRRPQSSDLIEVDRYIGTLEPRRDHLVEYLQTDIWVRFQKLRGHRCIYLCADDTHGTAIMLRAKSEEISEEELRYFRAHPDQIDEVSAPVYVHLVFLWAGGLLGAAFVAVSKWLKFSGLLAFETEAMSEFTIDIVFEIGVALIGAAVLAGWIG